VAALPPATISLAPLSAVEGWDDVHADRDGDIDLVASLPGSVSGSVLIRVVDTDRAAGHQTLDSVSIDEVFLRSIP
jgi:hypothetical protein